MGVGVLAAKAIVSRLQLCSRPSAISAVWCGGRLAFAPKAAGIDRRNCREGTTTPPHRFWWGRPCAGRDRRSSASTIISRPADLAFAFPRQRAGRRDKVGPGQPSMALDELVQLPDGDAVVARLQLGLGGRRGVIGRSRCLYRVALLVARVDLRRTQRLTGNPAAGAVSTLPFRASPVNGKPLCRFTRRRSR